MLPNSLWGSEPDKEFYTSATNMKVSISLLISGAHKYSIPFSEMDRAKLVKHEVWCRAITWKDDVGGAKPSATLRGWPTFGDVSHDS